MFQLFQRPTCPLLRDSSDIFIFNIIIIRQKIKPTLDLFDIFRCNVGIHILLILVLHFQLPEKLAQRRAVVAAQTIDGVEHRIEQAGFDVADIDAGLLYHLFLALARGFAQFAEPGPDPIDHLVIADVFLAHGRRLFPDCRSVQVRRLFPAQRKA